MQVFQPSSVLSVMVEQASRKYGALRCGWLSVLSLMGSLMGSSPPSLRVDLENSSSLGVAIELH